jgi:hypothetical protein
LPRAGLPLHCAGLFLPNSCKTTPALQVASQHLLLLRC